MRTSLLKLVVGAGLLAALSGCKVRMIKEDTHLMINPLHLYNHMAKIFAYEEGEIHNLHMSIDRVLFGIPNYDDSITSEPVYTHH